MEAAQQVARGSWHSLAFLGGWKSNSDTGSVGLRSIRSHVTV
jgi:hypothetical protein